MEQTLKEVAIVMAEHNTLLKEIDRMGGEIAPPDLLELHSLCVEISPLLAKMCLTVS